MALYCGVDLHSTNSFVSILDEQDRPVYEKRLANDLERIVLALAAYRDELVGVVVESTYNWYWLVDGLMAVGFAVHLANTGAIQQYAGLKHGDDPSDARFLAHLLRLGILPEGYIYPRAQGPLRDLLRKRLQMVRQGVTHLLSLQRQITRHTGKRLSGNEIKRLEAGQIDALLAAPEAVLAAQMNWLMRKALSDASATLERAALQRARHKPEFKWIRTISGIGTVLGLTIVLETGDIRRFPSAGNYASYARCVKSERISNGKRKGAGNREVGKGLTTKTLDTLHEFWQRLTQTRPEAEALARRSVDEPVAAEELKRLIAEAVDADPTLKRLAAELRPLIQVGYQSGGTTQITGDGGVNVVCDVHGNVTLNNRRG